jgi:Uma2 family endonuclease
MLGGVCQHSLASLLGTAERPNSANTQSGVFHRQCDGSPPPSVTVERFAFGRPSQEILQLVRPQAFDPSGAATMTVVAAVEHIVQRAELPRGIRAEQIMSMPVLRSDRWTIEEVEQLIDERHGLTPRYELVGGELLVTPAPSARHQRIIFELALRLQRYLTTHGLGEVFLGPSELKLVTGERYEPDLFVLPAIGGRRPIVSNVPSLPLLVCEVLSPGSSRHDRFTKRRAFQRTGVAEYWIIDADTQAFEIWQPGDERAALVDETIVWKPSGASEGCALDVRELFASTKDDGPLPGRGEPNEH